MRILQCTASLDPAAGGPARSVPQLASALKSLGHEVGLWSPQPGPDDANLPAVRRFSGAFAGALTEFGHPDVIHDNGLWLPCHHRVALEADRSGIPRVVSPRGMLEPWALKHKYWKKRAAWWLYQRRDLSSAKCLHATSPEELFQFRRLGLKQPAVVLPNGVAPPAGIQNHKSESRDRKPATRTALFLGRLHPKKGLELLVEAWAQVRPADWKMSVVGPDEVNYRQKIVEAVNRAGLSGSWSFEGMTGDSEKWRRMAQADLFILPSFSENFGIVVAEALAGGTPVVATTGTPWQGLREHRCGWWVEPTTAGIAGALREAVASSPDTLLEMGRRGAAWVQEAFIWLPIARRMAETYHWACSGGKQPDFLDVVAT